MGLTDGVVLVVGCLRLTECFGQHRPGRLIRRRELALGAVVAGTPERSDDAVGAAEGAVRRRIDRWTRDRAWRQVAAAAELVLIGHRSITLSWHQPTWPAGIMARLNLNDTDDTASPVRRGRAPENAKPAR